MHQGLRLSRIWLVLVLVAFCLPLFNGLGIPDLETDEAIYSFAVDRILEVGDWLEPKSSPSETAVFLEKPPLKFWLVAAPIKAGLLPHDEFGLRFLDAVAGSAAFVYVFAIGSILAGPVCGAVAVLLLFVHWPLLFAHGLRSNNMEASLVLSYCGGVFHVLRWSAVDEPRGRTGHAVAASLWFVLGFMTKFVAALFLPFMLAIAVVVTPRVRARLFAEWRLWGACAGLVLLLCGPWFAYAHVRFGSQLWETILGEHVLKRMTAYLDPTHLHPWYWYLQQMWKEFENEQMRWLIVAGVVTLLVQAARRRWFEGMVVLLWAAVPMAIISAGTSKLYHYAYPYLPPITLAAGYLVALVVMLAPAPLRRLLEAAEDRVATRLAPLLGSPVSPGARRIAMVLVMVGAALAIGAVALGGLKFDVGGRTVFRSSGIWRPIALILVAAIVTRSSARVTKLVVAIVAFNVMPLDAYRGQLEWTSRGAHPMRSAAACVQQVQASAGTNAGIYIDMPEGIWHPLYYYFRRVRPVTEATTPLDPVIDRYLLDPAAARPVLISDAAWRRYQMRRAQAGGTALSPPMVPFLNSLLLLPGPYATCSPEARLLTPR